MVARRSVAIFVIVVALSLAAFSQTNVHAIAEKVDRHYNTLESLQASFTEVYRGAGMERHEAGTLFLKRPGRMRWEYTQPRAKVFLISGRTAWFYVAGDQQAQKMAVKNMDDLRTPLAYLLGRTKLEKEFEGLSLAPDVKPAAAGDVVLRGVPRNMRDRVSQVLLEISPEGAIERITVDELDGSTTVFAFSNQKTNPPLSDARFRFTPPPGVNVVEAQQAFGG